MKSLAFISIVLVFISGCKEPDSGRGVRDNGPLQAYEQELVFDLDACSKEWQALSPYHSQCKISQTNSTEQYIWNARRIIQNWQYDDKLWSGDISIYFTTRGYKIVLLGSRSKPKEHYSFEVAQKYISSAIEKFKSKPVRQIILAPIEDQAPKNSKPLGSVILVNRIIDLRSEGLLDQCQKTWRNGQCYVDIINGTYKESLFEKTELTLDLNSVSVRAKGFIAWVVGSGLSDYKIFMIAKNSNTSFSQFRQDWLREIPDQTLKLEVQKFSGHKAQDYYQDQFIRFIDLEEWEQIIHQ